ncbi:hypothetical protein ACIRBY_15515 [Streptomyces sp. NPDC096136]|uniref:hypothetical protein n=1 Tax=Streptomyces sp. NPDC096136 TaxID=3366076 RepID=UPI0038026AC3
MVVTALLLSLMVLLMPFGLDAFENFLFPRPSAADRTESLQGAWPEPSEPSEPPEHGAQGVRYDYDLPETI